MKFEMAVPQSSVISCLQNLGHETSVLLMTAAVKSMGESVADCPCALSSIRDPWVVLSYVISQQHEAWSGARCTKQRSLPLCYSPGTSEFIATRVHQFIRQQQHSPPPPPALTSITTSTSITTRIHKLTRQHHHQH